MNFDTKTTAKNELNIGTTFPLSDVFLSSKVPHLAEKSTQTKSLALNESTPSLISSTPILNSKKKEEDSIIFSTPFFRKLFPWFSQSDHRSSKKSTKVSLWIPEIEKLLISNTDAAKEMYLEIENQLEIEERTQLKIKLLYHLNEWSSAEILAKAFLSERPQSPITPVIFYYLNKALQSQKKELSQNLILKKHTVKNLEPKLLSDFLRMLSDEALMQGDLFTAIRYRLDELKNAGTSLMADTGKLASLLKELKFVEQLNNLSLNFPNLTWLQDRIPPLKIEILVKQKRYHEALKIVNHQLKIARGTNHTVKIELLNKMQSNLSKAINLNPRRIGVILPLSSTNTKVASLAHEALNGLRMALRASEITIKKPLDTWELVIRDSHLNQEKTKSAMRELVEKEGVIAVIGPLARKTSEAAAKEAERLHIPLISLSLTADIPEFGDYVFRNNQSWKKEVQELLDYAVSELQACRFLILYAKTREGRQKMRHFWDAALHKGCKVVATEGFKNDGQKSLVNEFDTFTGKLQRISAKDKGILKELKEKEVPIHNFDAVFVAIGSGGVSNLSLIFPYSAVYKMEKTTFLGDNGWNDAALPYAHGLRGVKKLVFVDTFFPQDNTHAMQQLLRLHERILYRHQNYLGPTPYTAYAYDTLMILMHLLNDEKNQSHWDLRNALINMDNFSGVTGNLSFDEKGEVQRGIKLLTVRRGKIQMFK
ncbi:MAG: ABC transporter substrate-binding protein [SAR324 cluster bacterium]|nr:ABC transporter substrate-binding protein [SAR324 cluster bacterium]